MREYVNLEVTNFIILTQNGRFIIKKTESTFLYQIGLAYFFFLTLLQGTFFYHQFTPIAELCFYIFASDFFLNTKHWNKMNAMQKYPNGGKNA